MENTIKIEWLGRPKTLQVEFNQYRNGALAVILNEAEGEDAGEEFCVVSVNMPDASDLLPADAFYLKDWSENEPVAAELKRLGLIAPAAGIPPASSGFVQAHAYRWVDKAQTEHSLAA